MFQRPRTRGWHAAAWAAGLVLLALFALASIAIGSRAVHIGETWRALTDFDPGRDVDLIIWELRMPRTLLAMGVGASLGLAGALMQALTRNPLAEPGILGINSGASVAVAFGIVYLHLDSAGAYVGLGFLGAAAASIVVYLLGRAHDAGTNPVRLVLAGAGLSVMLGASAAIIVLSGGETLVQDYHNWASGSLQGRGYDLLPWVLGTMLLAVLTVMPLGRSLDAMSMGADLGRSLGVRMRATWVAGGLGVLLLAGAATAAAGPLAFVGLAAPHVSRLTVGPVHRRLLPFAMLLGALLLLAADIAGRVVAMPREIGAGVMAALVGAPFFIALARRRRLAVL